MSMDKKNPATTQKALTGIRAYIYRHGRQPESSLLYASNEVVIVGEGIVGNAVVSERNPAVYLSTSANKIYPPYLRPEGHRQKWLMFNGDHVSSNQPEFEALFGKGTFIKLHDRYEGNQAHEGVWYPKQTGLSPPDQGENLPG